MARCYAGLWSFFREREQSAYGLNQPSLPGQALRRMRMEVVSRIGKSREILFKIGIQLPNNAS